MESTYKSNNFKLQSFLLLSFLILREWKQSRLELLIQVKNECDSFFSESPISSLGSCLNLASVGNKEID